MNWNRDLRGAARKKRREYPTKRAMNLYFKEDRTTGPATAMLYILFILVVLGAAGKVMVFDRLQTLNALETEALRLEEETLSVQTRRADYQTVREDYTRLAPTAEELAEPDRTAVLDLIDEVIRPAARISQVTIQDRQVLVSFSGVTLVETAELVSRLEQSDLVARTTVDTAASEDGDRTRVDVDMLIELTGGEEAAEP